MIGKKITSVIHSFRQGEIIIVTDDKSRENEGDLVLAASFCTTEKIAFILRYTSGIVCVPMIGKRANELDLFPMVMKNDSLHHTAFTVSVDARMGTSTGISAYDRALTIQKLADGRARGSDFVRPGHVFPLIAAEGGVLSRPGHTEAAVDLCRISGLPEIGVICELMNDDGSVMRGNEIGNFAEKNHLHQLSIRDLIEWRQENDN